MTEKKVYYEIGDKFGVYKVLKIVATCYVCGNVTRMIYGDEKKEFHTFCGTKPVVFDAQGCRHGECAESPGEPYKVTLAAGATVTTEEDGSVSIQREHPDACSLCGKEILEDAKYEINMITGFVVCDRPHQFPKAKIEFKTIGTEPNEDGAWQTRPI